MPTQKLLACTILLSVALFSGPFARASTPPILLYGPGAPDNTLESRALATFNLLSDEQRGSPSVRHAGTALAPLADVTVVGSEEILTCHGSPVTLDPFREGLDKALTDIVSLELQEAQQTLARLDALLPCLNGVLPRDEIARISFLEGVGLAYFDQTAEARQSFRRALVVAPALQWDERFPPKARAVFNEAVYEAQHSPTAAIVVESLVGTTASVWLDGDLYSSGGGSATLVQGRHLIQWQVEGGGFGTVVVSVVEGDELSVISRSDIVSSAVSGRGSTAVLVEAAAALQRLAAETSREVLFLAELGDVDLLNRFEPTSGTWEVSDQGMVLKRVRGKRMTTAGQVSMIAGGVLAATGMAIGISGYLRGKGLREEEGSVQGAAEWEDLEQQYQGARQQAGAGFVVAGVGGAGMAIGIPLLVQGARDAGRSTWTDDDFDARLEIAPTGVEFSVRF